jgi:hypothetical protein
VHPTGGLRTCRRRLRTFAHLLRAPGLAGAPEARRRLLEEGRSTTRRPYADDGFLLAVAGLMFAGAEPVESKP